MGPWVGIQEPCQQPHGFARPEIVNEQSVHVPTWYTWYALGPSLPLQGLLDHDLVVVYVLVRYLDPSGNGIRCQRFLERRCACTFLVVFASFLCFNCCVRPALSQKVVRPPMAPFWNSLWGEPPGDQWQDQSLQDQMTSLLGSLSSNGLSYSPSPFLSPHSWRPKRASAKTCV